MNKEAFNYEMKKYGDTQAVLAIAMGLSRTRLNAKLNEKNGASFTQPEISFIRNRYQLSDQSVITIFFAENVS